MRGPELCAPLAPIAIRATIDGIIKTSSTPTLSTRLPARGTSFSEERAGKPHTDNAAIKFMSCIRDVSVQAMPPHVQRLSRERPIEDFIDVLERDGCVVVSNFTNTETVHRANAEIRPYLGQEGAKVGALSGKTQTVTRLVGRSQTVREEFFSDPLYQDLCENFLAIETTAWYGDEGRTNTSHPLLSISIAFDIPPGTPAQGLHRDDKNHHARHAAVKAYHKNRDMLFGLFVPGCDTTRENGATRVVLGSHLWGDEQPEFPEVTDAAMKVGEALIMLGSLYHGGGSYPEPGKESRTVYAMFCCSGVHRQEEISYLSYPIEEVKTYSKLVQDRLGWKQSEPNLGWVDLRSPEFMLQ